ncbi:MAG: histidinol-phosphatase [Phycisphaerales bacterium]|jgi:histidinol phosphatase-like enzyme (inositol monophosphatase family)|nr:histidinol-phosphatase [Phycisphaerales bacterium]
MSKIALGDLAAVAVEAAYLAGRRTLAHFNTGVAVETKSDQTPVTCADREAEEIIRGRIARTYPNHAILGEEQGSSGGGAGGNDYRWIIDPIDGTKSFIHGVPLYGVLIGVEVNGEPSVGVIYMPALDEMVWAADGLGCWWNGRRARVSEVSKLEEATLLSSSVTTCQARSDTFDQLADKVKLTRTWGDCYGYLLVATGRAEIMIDPKLNPWDVAPMPPILREAGGGFTTWSGGSSIHAGDGAAVNGQLLEPVRAILKAERKFARI